MKKGIVIGAAAGLLLGAAGIVFAAAQSEQTRAISSALKNETILTEKQQELLDMDKDGMITWSDYLRAKLDAALHKDSPMPVYYQGTAAKQLGRTTFHEDTQTLWCSLSGTGIEFRFKGGECGFTLVGDSACTRGDKLAPRYAYYVDGVLTDTAQLTEPEREITVAGKGTEEQTVRIVKLSESAQSAFGIRDLYVQPAEDGAAELSASAPAAHLIEFIGDSITCGYGVDGVFQQDEFKTGNENAEKAYAIRTAQKLGADYSLVSYSGHGVLSGYTSNGTLNKSDLVPRFYAEVGHSAATIESKHRIQDDAWDFSVQPDLIVINLGTNDFSYTAQSAQRVQAFTESYTAFLKTIREKNPDAQILCTLGIMGQGLCDAIDAAAAAYTKETGDTNIRTMRFAMQTQEDGFAVDWHPSAATHEKAAEQLAAYIRDWLGW